MRKLMKEIISPKLITATVVIASFAFAPTMVQAGDKEHQKKPEHVVKKAAETAKPAVKEHAKKVEDVAKKAEHKAPKKVEKPKSN